jgi:hypothetical protein
VHDVGRCRDRRDHRDRHVPEDLLDRRDLDLLVHQSHGLLLDHLGVAPCRDDPHLDHRGDPHLGSSDATDHRCRPDHGRVRSAECDQCAHQYLRDADHRDHDPSADAELHRDDGSHRVVAESGGHFPAAEESDDHSARDVATDPPAAVAVLQLVESVEV